jgi:hypothetical protein
MLTRLSVDTAAEASFPLSLYGYMHTLDTLSSFQKQIGGILSIAARLWP